MTEILTYKNKKGNLVEAEITGHAIMRFRERYCILRGADGTPPNLAIIKLMATLSKHQIADMMRQRFKVAIREKRPKKSRIDGYEGGSVYFLDGAFRYVFADGKLITVELTNSHRNKIHIPIYKHPYEVNDTVIASIHDPGKISYEVHMCLISNISAVPILDDTPIEVVCTRTYNQWESKTMFMAAAKNLKLMLPCSVCGHNAIVIYSTIVNDKIICGACVGELEEAV